jgi:hypothetical protein
MHEPPVLSLPIQVVLRSADLLVLNKPSSIPVHPTGVYRENSVIAVLATEMGFSDLHRTLFSLFSSLLPSPSPLFYLFLSPRLL